MKFPGGTMDEFESLSHSRRESKYHVVFIPKCRRKALYARLRRHLGQIFRELAPRKECEILEGHLMPDHVHMLIAIPPKYAVSQGRRGWRQERGAALASSHSRRQIDRWRSRIL